MTTKPKLRLVKSEPADAEEEDERLERERLEREELARWKAEVEPPKPMPVMSFRVKPRYLSPEHARHYERFTSLPYDAEEDARCRSWAAFKRWHHKLQVDHTQQRLAQERARLISTLHARLQALQQTAEQAAG